MIKKTRREKVVEQIELMEIIQAKADINIVNCGHCGSVFLHKMEPDLDVLECPYCDRVMGTCDCPDFLYDGCEDSSEFDDPEEESPFEMRFNKAKSEILDDIICGLVPETVKSFEELHTYRDANAYGGFCEVGYVHSNGFAFENKVQKALDEWIKSDEFLSKK